MGYKFRSGGFYGRKDLRCGIDSIQRRDSEAAAMLNRWLHDVTDSFIPRNTKGHRRKGCALPESVQ